MKTQQNEMTRYLLLHSVTLSLLCVISYWLITHMLAQVFWVSRDDDLLGGMWAVVATIFVYRYSCEASAGASLSRMGGNFIKLRSLFYLPALFPVPSLGIGDVDWGGIC